MENAHNGDPCKKKDCDGTVWFSYDKEHNTFYKCSECKKVNEEYKTCTGKLLSYTENNTIHINR